MSDYTPPLIMLTAGGTAGHMFPANSLASELSERGYRVVFVTDQRGKNYQPDASGVDIRCIAAGGVAGKSLLAKLRSFGELAVGFVQSLWILQRNKPDAVIGFGGYASVPVMMAAKLGGFPAALHEQNAVLGRANRLFASNVKSIGTCFDKIEGLAPEDMAKVIRTGLPVRQAVAEVENKAYPEINQDTQWNLMITGGSQGARVFSDVVPEAIGLLDESLRKNIRITQQCRPEDIERVRKAYEEFDVMADLNQFFPDLPEKIAAAHLVIGRAGASTVAEVTVIGRPTILVPYPYAIDDHQSHNAHALDEVGAGWLMPESSFTPAALAERLSSLISMPTLLQKAASSAKLAGTPDASKKLADMAENILVSKIRTNGNGNGNDTNPGQGRQVA